MVPREPTATSLIVQRVAALRESVVAALRESAVAALSLTAPRLGQ